MTTKKSKDSLIDPLEKLILGGPLTFGEAITALRLRDEIIQAKLVRKMGIFRQYLCDVEKGKRQISATQAARFAKTFGHPSAVLVQLALQDSIRAGG
ncbi:MAG: helix-turn-helix transcriptional regulator, partial [Pseudomonadota bacterium]